MPPRNNEAEALEEVKSFGWNPLEPYPGVDGKWRMRHLCGEEANPTLSNLRLAQRNGRTGCMACGRNSSREKRQSDPEKVDKEVRSYGFRPLESFRNVDKKWKLRHDKCGRVVEPTLSSLRQARREKFESSGCDWCGREIRGQKRRLHEAIVEERLAARGVLKEGEFVCTKSALKCRCLECGSECMPRVGNLVKQGGCKSCVQATNSSTSHLYVIMFHSIGDYVKVGVSQPHCFDNRIRDHYRNGADISTVHFLTCPTLRAAQMERSIKRWCKTHGVPNAKSNGLIKFDGYTEMWKLEDLHKAGITGGTPSEIFEAFRQKLEQKWGKF